MTQLEAKIEAEIEDFDDELSDEALDREGADRFLTGSPFFCLKSER